jgi:formylglycine-generating enzyme required for sulfatase activity
MPRQISIFLSSMVIFGMIQLGSQVHAQSPKEITNSIGMKLVLIPKGTFMMGSPESEEGHQENESQHEVTISKDYYLGAFEVTQTQYQTVTGNNPSCYRECVMGRCCRILQEAFRPARGEESRSRLSFADGSSVGVCLSRW